MRPSTGSRGSRPTRSRTRASRSRHPFLRCSCAVPSPERSVAFTRRFSGGPLTHVVNFGQVLDDDETLWVADEDLDDLTRARMLAIKVLTSRCIAYAGTDSAAKASLPVFQLLWPLLQARDENSRYRYGSNSRFLSIYAGVNLFLACSPPVASRLRLVAGLSILKLATQEAFLSEISKRFDVLARTARVYLSLVYIFPSQRPNVFSLPGHLLRSPVRVRREAHRVPPFERHQVRSIQHDPFLGRLRPRDRHRLECELFPLLPSHIPRR